MRLRKIAGADAIVAGSPFVVQNPASMRGAWRRTPQQPLYIEIGMGKGRFLIETACAHPENEYVGLERYTSVLFRACERMAGIPYHTPADQLEQEADPELAGNLQIPQNVRFISADARELPEFFAEEEVDGIFLNFSDPWPKARHADRRLTSEAFLNRYEKILKSGGRVEFKTDNMGLFKFSLEELERAPHWELLQVTRDLHRDPDMSAENIMTEYERKFSKLGNKICKLIAVFHKDN